MTYENLGLRLPEIGRVKIGQKGKEKISTQGNKFQPPEKLDHFRIVTLERGPDNNFVVDSKTHAAIGEEKPKMLPVRFLGKTIGENIIAGWARYIGTECVCSGDGKTGEEVNRQTGEITKKACPCENADLKKDPCKMQGKAIFIIDGGRLGGFYSISIKGTTIVPPFVGSLQSLIDICDRAGGSIAGIPIEMHLASYTHKKFGKVYYPRFEYCGDLATAAKNANASRLSALVDDGAECDDEHGVEYPTAEETNGGTQDEEPANYGPAAEPEKKPESPKPESKPKSDAKPKIETTAPKIDDKPKADASSASPALKAFWCDACHKIINDHAKPAVCKCGCNTWHDATNMKAAQEAIAKRIADKPKSDPKLEPAPDRKVVVWCRSCYGIAEITGKPRACSCGANDWVGAGSLDDAKKQIEEAKKAAEAAKPADEPKDGMAEMKAIRDKKLATISSCIKLVFGSSTTPAVLKQVSLLLDQKVEGSQYLCDQDVDDLVELLEIIKDMPKNDRDQFISDWKQGRAEADAAEGVVNA